MIVKAIPRSAIDEADDLLLFPEALENERPFAGALNLPCVHSLGDTYRPVARHPAFSASPERSPALPCLVFAGDSPEHIVQLKLDALKRHDVTHGQIALLYDYFVRRNRTEFLRRLIDTLGIHPANAELFRFYGENKEIIDKIMGRLPELTELKWLMRAKKDALLDALHEISTVTAPTGGKLRKLTQQLGGLKRMKADIPNLLADALSLCTSGHTHAEKYTVISAYLEKRLHPTMASYEDNFYRLTASLPNPCRAYAKITPNFETGALTLNATLGNSDRSRAFSECLRQWNDSGKMDDLFAALSGNATEG